jgi:hypothetical protein
MINQNQIHSITDLRFKTKKVLEKAKKGPIFLFHRHTPKGVLLSFESYQEILSQLEDYFDSIKAERYEKEEKSKVKWIPFSEIKKMIND